MSLRFKKLILLFFITIGFTARALAIALPHSSGLRFVQKSSHRHSTPRSYNFEHNHNSHYLPQFRIQESLIKECNSISEEQEDEDLSQEESAQNNHKKYFLNYLSFRGFNLHLVETRNSAFNEFTSSSILSCNSLFILYEVFQI